MILLDIDNLPDAERALAVERAKWFKDRARIAALEDLCADYRRRIAAGKAKQAAWEAAHPGQDYISHHSDC